MKIPRLQLRVKNRTTRGFSIQIVGEGPVLGADGQYELVEIVLSEPGAEGACGTYEQPVSVWYREACLPRRSRCNHHSDCAAVDRKHPGGGHCHDEECESPTAENCPRVAWGGTSNG